MIIQWLALDSFFLLDLPSTYSDLVLRERRNREGALIKHNTGRKLKEQENLRV